MMATVYERMMFLAKGGTKEYRHNMKKRKENKKATKLQDFLGEVIIRKTGHRTGEHPHDGTSY